MTDQPVVVVTGGGAGIGAAVAEEIGRHGAFVVTMDPLVTLDGAEQLPAPEETTAGRIVAAGGAARASSVSVTDGDGVRALFAELVDEFGRLDAVVNVAGISRPTSFTAGSVEDWRAVLEVHLDGYLNILAAALPIMAAAGHGRILGVTSGSGWRMGDAGAYGCAKRAVAALTWEIGEQAPPGVVVNAMSPIAMTRMVTAALERAGRAAGGNANAAGPLFGSMPEPGDIGPIGAYLASDAFAWATGQIIFAGGAEVAVVEPPHLLEVVRVDDAKSLPHVFEAAGAKAWISAEAKQLSGGGSNPRFGTVFDTPDGDLPAPAVSSCALVSDRPDLADAITAALEARGVSVTAADDGIPADVGAVVLALACRAAAGERGDGWESVLAQHDGIVDDIFTDARWARAVSDYTADNDRPLRLVTLTDAVTSAGRSRAQAAAQHARPSRKATSERVAVFAVSIETDGVQEAGELAAYLLCSPDAVALSGAELVAGDGWVGLRSHPQPSTSISFGGPAVPAWLDDVLRSVIR